MLLLSAQSFLIFCPFRRAGTRLLFVKWLLSKPKVGLLVVPKTCAYGESPCDLSSYSKHRAAFRDRYSTVHRFVNVFLKSCYERSAKNKLCFSHSHFSPKNATARLLPAVCINHGLDLFHQRIIILLIVRFRRASALLTNISISI